MNKSSSSALTVSTTPLYNAYQGGTFAFASFAVDAEADGYDGIQIIVSEGSHYLPLAFLPNCSEIPNSCTFFQFFLLVYILDMFADINEKV